MMGRLLWGICRGNGMAKELQAKKWLSGDRLPAYAVTTPLDFAYMDCALAGIVPHRGSYIEINLLRF